MIFSHTRAKWLVRGTALTLFASSVVFSAFAGARAPQERDAPRDWQAWLEAVHAHAPGARDGAVSRVAGWSLDELESVLGSLQRDPATAAARPPLNRLRIVERGLVLHADVAVLHRVPTGYDLPGGQGGVTLFEDGRAVGQMSRTVHWEFARLLLERLPEGDDRERVGRRFYRATAAVLQLWGEYPELTAHLSGGRDLLGDDPVLLMYEGTMRQAYAGPRMQRFFDERRRSEARPARFTALPERPSATSGPVTVMPGLPASLPSVRESRAQAERLFRRALELDPTLAEARIRLAHVLGDAGRHDQAAAELVTLTPEKLPSMLAYYAALLTGREARALGRLEAARDAFRRAAVVYPNAPAPQYGLSELAMAEGDRAESLAHIVSASAAARVAADEPWWWIERVHVPSAGDLINDLRRLSTSTP